MKQPFQIIKAANNGKTDADLLKGAGFTAYLESSLTKKADGNYEFASATPVVIGENGCLLYTSTLVVAHIRMPF